MSAGEARCNQSAIALSFGRKQREPLSQCSNKKPREEIGDSNSAVIASHASTATIGPYNRRNPKLLSPQQQRTYYQTKQIKIEISKIQKVWN